MDKKELKFYETPEVEIVNVEVECQILAGSDPESAELPDVEFEE